jgi:hypothetical protein
MQLDRTYYYCVITVLFVMLLIGVTKMVSLPPMEATTTNETRLTRHVAVRLASFTSPDPDPRHPTDWLRVSTESLDRTLGEVLLIGSADGALWVP